MNKNEIANKIEEALASLPDDLKAVVKLTELVAELRGCNTNAATRGGGNGNGPPGG